MLPEPITALTAALSKLPGIGPRSAERIALHLVQTESALVEHLANVMVHARERILFRAFREGSHGPHHSLPRMVLQAVRIPLLHDLSAT